MKCALENEIDHGDVRKQFRDTLVYCPLFERKGTGMASLGVLCSFSCLRIQMLREAKSELLLRSVVSVEDYRRNPDVIAEHLPQHLQEYYLALKERGKTVKDVDSECSRCRPEPIGNRPVKAAGKTEMTQCGKNDLR